MEVRKERKNNQSFDEVAVLRSLARGKNKKEVM
jgi:hypothetical protein